MTNAVLYELSRIIFWLIESDNMTDVEMLKNLNIVLRRLCDTFLRFSSIHRSHKGDKLAWNDEVEISIV